MQSAAAIVIDIFGQANSSFFVVGVNLKSDVSISMTETRLDSLTSPLTTWALHVCMQDLLEARLATENKLNVWMSHFSFWLWLFLLLQVDFRIQTMDNNANYSRRSSSDSTSQEDKNNNGEEEQLGTGLRLRLMASHLPKVGGKRLGVLTRRSPDTFASVTSIVRKEGKDYYHSQSSSLPACAETQRKRNEGEFMVEWGSTEM